MRNSFGGHRMPRRDNRVTACGRPPLRMVRMRACTLTRARTHTQAITHSRACACSDAHAHACPRKHTHRVGLREARRGEARRGEARRGERQRTNGQTDGGEGCTARTASAVCRARKTNCRRRKFGIAPVAAGRSRQRYVPNEYSRPSVPDGSVGSTDD